jgi:hypothetical protein
MINAFLELIMTQYIYIYIYTLKMLWMLSPVLRIFQNSIIDPNGSSTVVFTHQTALLAP